MDSQTEAKILNDIEDKQAYKSTYPVLTGKSEEGALHELHVFLLPLNPEQSVVDRCLQVTDLYNQERASELNGYPMKMCYLTLLFRTAGPVKVLQSARYLRSNDQDEVVKEIYKDAEFFRKHGFDVVRIKIEANAHASKGIPLTDEDAGKHPKYFEFHVKVAHKSKKDDVAISKEEEEELAEISKKFTQTFQAPIPLSWNNLANPGNHENPGYQRFLNIRFRNTGYKNCSDNLNALHKAINENTNFKVVKSIDEYVWFDTLTAMDHGWIDFNPGEEVPAQ